MIPTVDLDAWRDGDTWTAPAVDEALQRAGFLLVTRHGVDAAVRDELRVAARRFCALPRPVLPPQTGCAVCPGAPRRDLGALSSPVRPRDSGVRGYRPGGVQKGPRTGRHAPARHP